MSGQRVGLCVLCLEGRKKDSCSDVNLSGMEWNGVRFCYFALNCIKSEEFKSYCLFWNFAFNSTELELTVVC